MRCPKSVLFLASSVATESAFMISCGDNWHLGVDATVDAPQIADAAPACNCPGAEPPLAGRFIVLNNLRTIPADDRGGESYSCTLDMQPIAGSCTVDNATAHFNVTLEQSGGYPVLPGTWACEWRNYEPFPVRIRVSVVCLKLAP